MIADPPRAGALAPPLKWAGGKRWLLPHLAPLWEVDRSRRLVEPFVGGLAVTLGLRPERALLCDLNPHLIAFYRRLQTGLIVEPGAVAFENNREAYNRNRDRFNALIGAGQSESAEAAALFYYLNRTGYNGLCRFNRRGLFNVPFGRHKSIPYVRDFSPYAEALRGFDLVCQDFTSLNIRSGDLVYADPPYDVVFTTYSAGGFRWEDQLRLAEWLAKLPAPVIASNAATPRILDLYRGLGFDLRTLPAPRRINCTGNRDEALEMLAVKGTTN